MEENQPKNIEERRKTTTENVSGNESKLHIGFNELFDYLLHVLIIVCNRLRAAEIRLSHANASVG